MSITRVFDIRASSVKFDRFSPFGLLFFYCFSLSLLLSLYLFPFRVFLPLLTPKTSSFLSSRGGSSHGPGRAQAPPGKGEHSFPLSSAVPSLLLLLSVSELQPPVLPFFGGLRLSP
ncbi:hypothetical protein RchiOBHm_Chr2g0134311 [Rosa chinensis]|uniref:Transmembrane protein n=1 Tax=Rosa chinensis TaxID=74649 RepID=A0A2P6RVT1_ROSCH|nr:hypothetical protein RchiOBHm_Chr2g0134311 [Rosa chinensis]